MEPPRIWRYREYPLRDKAFTSRAPLGDNREIKIHVYRKRQTSDLSWEFLRIENKQIKTVPNDSYG